MPREERLAKRGLGGIGFYKQGLPHGHFWLETYGGSGMLHGVVDGEDHTLSGDKIMFMFGDFQTIFYGKFKDRQMVGARWATLEFFTIFTIHFLKSATRGS